MTQLSPEMLIRLSKNPHYKMTAEQKAQLAAIENKPMMPLSNVHVHETTPEKHKVRIIRRKP